jgi:formylglycine-generating enzyme required for sulfatase activity
VVLSAAVAAGLLMLPLSCRRKDAAPGLSIKTVIGAAGVEMVLIPAGEFRMGSDDGQEDERPVHKVRLGAFYMDRCEVTQKSFEDLMGQGKNPSRFKDPNGPVERVSWQAAIRYCNARSAKEGLPPCYDLQTLACDFAAAGYRLPTEAEWEYACRAGTQGPYSFDGGADRLGEYAWFKGNSGQTSHPVGGKKPNPWGLYDMHGNVAEWCNDYYGPHEYSATDATDPRGPASGDYRVLRGGSWRSGEGVCRSAARVGETPGVGDTCLGYEAYGFRCARKAE